MTQIPSEQDIKSLQARIRHRSKETCRMRQGAARIVGYFIQHHEEAFPSITEHTYIVRNPEGGIVMRTSQREQAERCLTYVFDPLSSDEDCYCLLMALIQAGYALISVGFASNREEASFAMLQHRQTGAAYTGHSRIREPEAARRETLTRACILAWNALHSKEV